MTLPVIATLPVSLAIRRRPPELRHRLADEPHDDTASSAVPYDVSALAYENLTTIGCVEPHPGPPKKAAPATVPEQYTRGGDPVHSRVVPHLEKDELTRLGDFYLNAKSVVST